MEGGRLLEQTLFDTVSDYTFGVLFIGLLVWVLRNNDRREREMLDKLSQITNTLQGTTQVIQSMQGEISTKLSEIKELLQERRRDL